MTFPVILAPGATATITVDFTPTAAGARSGAVSIVSNAGTSPTTIALAGTGAAPVTPPPPTGLTRLSTSGNQIVDSTGAPLRLRSINWFGGEGPNYIANGIWSRSYKAILDQIKTLGFNCIRYPLSDDVLTEPASAMTGGVAAYYNPDLAGLTAIQCLDMILAYCNTIGIYVVLDQHRTTAAGGSGTDGWPNATFTDAYTPANWLAFWSAMATRYASNVAVCGFDVHNEPYNPDWPVWAPHVEALVNAVHLIAPDWLAIVEGNSAFAGVNSWWGGALQGVASRPISLTIPHKVVYSPHEYGLSVSTQAWLESTTNTVAGWPDSLGAIWDARWGFIFRSGIAPLWLGEFGGKLGFTGGGAADPTQTNATYEVAWFNTLVQYLNGDMNLSGGTVLTGAQKGMSFSFWSLNPNSGDTGGLLQDDWITPQAGKLALLAPLLTV